MAKTKFLVEKDVNFDRLWQEFDLEFGRGFELRQGLGGVVVELDSVDVDVVGMAKEIVANHDPSEKTEGQIRRTNWLRRVDQARQGFATDPEFITFNEFCTIIEDREKLEQLLWLAWQAVSPPD